MKKILLTLFCLILSLSMIACSSSSSNDTTKKDTSNQTQEEQKKDEVQEDKKEQEQSQDKKEYQINDTIKVGDNELTLTGTGFDKNSEGKELIKLIFKWKNGTQETTSFDMVFGFKAFQDGIEVKGVELIGMGSDNPDNKYKEIRPDKEIGDNFRWFELDSDKPIELEVYKAQGLMLEGEPTIIKIEVPKK